MYNNINRLVFESFCETSRGVWRGCSIHPPHRIRDLPNGSPMPGYQLSHRLLNTTRSRVVFGNHSDVEGHAFSFPEPSVSFGHVIDETKGSGRSQNQMSVNLGHLTWHAHFFQVLITVSERREDIDRIHKRRLSHYSFLFMVICLTSFDCTNKIQNNLRSKMRQERMSSTKTKE